MGLESGSFLNDLVITNPVTGDPRSEGDDHLRLLKTVLKATFPGLAGAAWRFQTKSAGYTPVATDNMTVFNCTTGLTLSLTAAATLANGWLCLIHANGGAVVIDPNAAETVNGVSTLTVPDGAVGILLCTGTAFYFYGLSRGVAFTVTQTSSAGVGNGADATDDTLFTYSLPSGSLSANGKVVRAIAWGKFASGTNGKEVKLWFDGNTISNFASGGYNNISWMVEAEIARIDSTHVSVACRSTVNAVADYISCSANLAVADLTTNASIVKVTGASATSTAGDISGYGMTVTLIN